MNQDQLHLSKILRRTVHGQAQIQTILKTAIGTQLRKALLIQLKEYRIIEVQAHSLSSAKGWRLRNYDPFLQYLFRKLIKLRLGALQYDSNATSYMMRNCMNGIIDTLTVLHHDANQISPISLLARRLLDCERSCIEQLQEFL